MLKHTNLVPVKKRSKSQSSETSEICDGKNRRSGSAGLVYQSDDDVCRTSTSSGHRQHQYQQSHQQQPHTRNKISRRRPPTGTDTAVRRWNSFHSTRGECHPNKFRKDRKSTLPSLDYNGGKRSHQGSPSASIKATYELRRGKSLAEKSTSSSVGIKPGFLSTVTSPSTDLAASPTTCFGGKCNGGNVRKSSELFMLETSEMTMIDYPESTHQTSSSASSIPQTLVHHRTNNAAINSLSYGNSHQLNSTLSLGSIGQYPLSLSTSSSSSTMTPTGIGNMRGGGAGGGNNANNCSGVVGGYGNSTSGGSGGGNLISSYRRSIGGSGGHISNIDHHIMRHTGVNIVFEDGGIGNNRPELYQKCNRGSHSSDTSSAYSGSDTMTSVHSSSLDTDEVDLSGLVESVVDSDEEDLAESMDSLAVRDTVRECLEKDPSDRTEDDIETLLDFTKNLKAFTNMTLAVRRDLCSVMVFAVVEKAGTMVMNNGEELDSWSVLINGHVEIEHANGEKEELQVGDSFGILPTMDKLYHRGVMRTKCHDCQFVCITQTDYYRIQHQGEENTKKHEEDGHVVMVTELRHAPMESGARRGHVVIRGTPERLMLQLIEENSITDPTYVEDFLLTHRTFIDSPINVAKQLLTWFENEDPAPWASTATPTEIRDRVTRVVLLWVNNHFTDFETDSQMMEFLETFEAGLEKKAMLGHLRLLHIACAAKARTRTITLARSSRDEDLHFTIIGGYEKGGLGGGVFISKVESKSKAEDVGLKRGDQILEVNGQSFEHVTLTRAMESMTGTTHLSITVKSNLLTFKDMLQNVDQNSPRPRHGLRGGRKLVSELAKLQIAAATADPATRTAARLSSVELSMSHDIPDCANSGIGGMLVAPSPMKDGLNANVVTAVTNTVNSGANGNNNNIKKDNISSSSSSASSSSSTSHKGGFMTLGPKRRLQKALIKMNLLPKNAAALLLESLNQQEQDDAVTNSSVVITSGNQSSGSVSGSITGVTNNNSNNNSLSTSALYQSHSNPDLTTAVYYDDPRSSDYPEHVLKVYKSDQTCKYLLVHKETTAHEVVMLALQEFGIHETSSNFSLCEVSVGEGGMIKQRRLPEQLQNLAERIGLAARYYLKTNGITETLVPDEMAAELIRESAVHFLQLNANELAIQLTFQDFAIFRQIESTEYVDDLFELAENGRSKYGVPMLRQFSQLVNREMFWVVSEVCSEPNMVRRMKIIKQFIKIARHCKECRNFNSMFAIISGLGHAAVSRLRATWEKLPTKYQKLFCDLQELMDPSRNMSKYRQLILTEMMEQHPIIPFYPLVKKDLTFIHLGNDSYVENLINFEKLRMIAKEVRNLTHMCSSPYDLLTMLELKGQPPSSAMVALNQMSVSASAGGNSYIHAHAQQGQATVKRRKKSTTAPNPKKMFEEAQMVRRVKAYLNNIKVITDEDGLHSLSLECEPSGSGSGSAPNTNVTIRKRHPSPTLSTTSSTSSTSGEGKKGGGAGLVGPKFGAASPQAVKKILSLSEQNKTRPHQPRHPTVGLPLNTNPVVGGLNLHHHHTGGLHYPLHHHHSSSISPSPSPGAHRRIGSSSSAGSVSYSTQGFNTQINTGCGRAVHERSHSDTPTPLPSVDLSVESSSVTSLSNLPLRKSMASGSVTSSDSGHGSCVQTDAYSNCSESGGNLYHVASSIVHNSPSPTTMQQRRHSAMHGASNISKYGLMSIGTSSISTAITHTITNSPQLPMSPPPIPPSKPLSFAILPLPISSPPPPTPPLSSSSFSSPSLSSSSSSSSLPSSTVVTMLTSPPLLPLVTAVAAGPPPPTIPPRILSPSPSSSSSSSSTSLSSTPSPATFGGGGGGGGGIGGIGVGIGIGGGGVTPPLPPPFSHAAVVLPPLPPYPAYIVQSSSYHLSRPNGHSLMAPPPPKGPRHPPAYSVAAQMARLHRLGRAHSHEGVTSGTVDAFYINEPGQEEDDDEDTQVSAV